MKKLLRLARTAALVTALVAAPTALAQETQLRSKWGSVEVGAGPFIPDLDAEFGGAHAPYKAVFEHFGFTVDHVYAEAKTLLKKSKRSKPKPQPRKVATRRSVKKLVSRR